MPDAFFVSSKSRKRKRSSSKPDGLNKRSTINGKGRPKSQAQTKPQSKKRRDEELESDATQDEGFEGIDDMDLRASDVDSNARGEEDETETPAEKRLRLANMYLEEMKEGLGKRSLRYDNRLSVVTNLLAAEGDYDAAEIDKEIIAARLKQDVQESSGKVYRYIADSVCANILHLKVSIMIFSPR